MTVDLVLLHGFTGAPSSWDAVLAALPGRRAFRPALLGHAGATAARAGSFADEVDRLAGELSAGGLRPGAHLVGYSLGGRMAVGLLVRHRALFSRATLIGAHAGLPAGDAAGRAARAEQDERWARLAEENTGRFLATWEDQPLFATQRGLSASALDAQRRTRLENGGAGLARSLRVVGLARMPDHWADLVAIDRPLTLVAGQLDDKFGAIAQRMAAALPNARVIRVPGAGHNAVLEAPSSIAELLAHE